MRIKRLIIGNEFITNNYDIKTTLNNYGFNWLNDVEIDNAVIEIKNGKIYWHSGIFYYGTWEYGIVLNGEFRYCEWKNGIFYNGKFRGVWMDGIFVNGIFDTDSKFINGDMRLSESVLSFNQFKK